MINMRKPDEFASEMIPIRLLISIAVISAIAIMVTIGYNNLNVVFAENNVENECRSLESKLYTMVSSGVARDLDEIDAGDGTKRVHTFSLPNSIIYLSFGVDPDPENNGILRTGLTCNGSVIFYKVQGGSKHVIWLSEEKFRFREGKNTGDKWVINGEGQGFIIKNSGETSLVFELVKRDSETFILIQANDGIEP
ncbi:MAG: hypothetical protein QHH19_03095 [Candidatus Thermoplasmatota archaeon]|jgi:hypothetical protein|nr:hypothetical protein [Candidatus Thermoplasmatota archaeon]